MTRAEHTSRYARHLERLGLTKNDLGVDEAVNVTRRLQSQIKRRPSGPFEPKPGVFYYTPGKTPLRLLVEFLRDKIYTEPEIAAKLKPVFEDWLSKLPAP